MDQMNLQVCVGTVESVFALVVPVHLQQLPCGVEVVGAVDCEGELGGAAGWKVDLRAVMVGIRDIDNCTCGPIDLHCALRQRGQTCSTKQIINSQSGQGTCMALIPLKSFILLANQTLLLGATGCLTLLPISIWPFRLQARCRCNWCYWQLEVLRTGSTLQVQ